MKYAIGEITCDDENHGHSISNIVAQIDDKHFIIKNYEEHKEAINRIAGNSIYYYGGSGALFRCDDDGVVYIPADKIASVELT